MESGYLLNIESKVIHNLEQLSEKCNTDDIAGEHKEHVNSDDLPRLFADGFTCCQHCWLKEADDATS